MKTPTKQAGFSLLEILIAFSILALSLGILLKIFSGGVNTAIVSEQYTSAVQIAESLMAKVGIETPLQLGETSGEEDERFHWKIIVNPYPFNPENVDIKTQPAELFKINVIVSWDDDNGHDRLIELTTLRIANKLVQ
jgi:general secretion pathway protein I